MIDYVLLPFASLLVFGSLARYAYVKLEKHRAENTEDEWTPYAHLGYLEAAPQEEEHEVTELQSATSR